MDDASVLLYGTCFLMYTLCLLPKGDEFRMTFEAVERHFGGIFLGDPNQVLRAGPMGLACRGAIIQPEGIIGVLCTTHHEGPLSVHKKRIRTRPKRMGKRRVRGARGYYSSASSSATSSSSAGCSRASRRLLIIP